MTTNNSEDIEDVNIDRLELSTLHPTSNDDPDNIGGCIYLVIGPSGTGKTNMIMNLLYSKKHFIPVCTVISETEDVNNTFSRRVPPLFIYNTHNSEIVKKVLKRQIVATNAKLENTWSTLILDDCMSSDNKLTDSIHKKLFNNSRQSKLMVYISCQHSINLPPNLRDQCAGYFILQNDNEDSRKKIYENFASVIPNKKLFEELMTQLTNDRCCMFIDKRTISSNWKDKIKWFKPVKMSDYDWSAVSKDVQAYNDARLDPEYNSFERVLSSLK